MLKRLAFLLFIACPASHAANYTVCASGCNYSTITTAIAGSASTDTIQLMGNITENVWLSGNIAMIWVDTTGTRYTWTGTGVGNTNTFELSSNMNQAMTLSGLTMDQPSGTGNTILWATTGANAHLRIFDTVLNRTSTTSGDIFACSNGNAADLLYMLRTKVIGNANANHGVVFYTDTTAGSVTIGSSLFVSIGGYGLRDAQSSSNQVMACVNSTFDSCVTAYSSGCASTLVNNAFTNNTTDLYIFNSASHANFTYCGFGQQTNTGDFGAGCFFGVSGSGQYVGGGDYHLVSSSSFVTTGTTNTIGTPDLDNKTRPQGSAYCVGAYEFIPTFTRKGASFPLWWFTSFGK